MEQVNEEVSCVSSARTSPLIKCGNDHCQMNLDSPNSFMPLDTISHLKRRTIKEDYAKSPLDLPTSALPPLPQSPNSNLSFSKDGPLDNALGDTSLWPRAHEWNTIHVVGNQFVDQYGRTLMLRGVNLCGNSKLPTSPPGSTHLSAGFYYHRQVSFVGRPFPLTEAHEHFQRLRCLDIFKKLILDRAWGLTFVRLLVPWESLGMTLPDMTNTN